MNNNQKKDAVNRILDNNGSFELPVFSNGKLAVRITNKGNYIVFEPISSGEAAMDRLEEIEDSINSTNSIPKLANTVAEKTFATAIDGGYASTLLGRKAQLGTCTMLKAAALSQDNSSSFGFLISLDDSIPKDVAKINIPTIQYETSKNGLLVPVITDNGMVASINKNGVFVDCKKISPEDFNLFCENLRLSGQINNVPEEQINDFIKNLRDYSRPIEAKLEYRDFNAAETFADAMFKASDLCGLDQKLKSVRTQAQVIGYTFLSGTFNMGMGKDGNLTVFNEEDGIKPIVTKAPKVQ